MKKYTVQITRQAREHLYRIRNYIAYELMSPETAYKTIALLRKEIKSLSQMPSRIKLVEEEPWRSEKIHRMRVKNYYVYFWIDEENSRVQIMAIIYVSRNQVDQLKIMKMK